MSVCGNNTIETGESCDDGNTTDGDGCSATCSTESSNPNPVCGNNILETGEQCDDGNVLAGDGCDATCQTESTTPVAICGNNTIETGESCDDGNTVNGDGCDSVCAIESGPADPYCGDGNLDSGEECDDGNLSNGDGCNAICETEETSGGITPESIIPVATGMNGSLIFHHEDHLTGAGVDTDDTGAIISLIDYYPFGDTRIEENSGDYENDYKFTGKEKDEDTGLYYYGSRYYDSAIGRFTAVDPWSGELTDPQTLNKYSYVTNNPLKYVDPSGEERLSVLIELPTGNELGYLSRKGLAGHAGLAVENQFYDYGPAQSASMKSLILGTEGGQWWDNKFNNGDARLSDILSNVDNLTGGERDMFMVTAEVTPEQAEKVQGYWSSLYDNPGNYSLLLGRQCTTSVAASLSGAGLINTTGMFQNPSELLEVLSQELQNTYGNDKGKPATIQNITNNNDGTDNNDDDDED